MNNVLKLIVVVVFMLGLSGCWSSHSTPVQVSSQTQGQELVDLKKAFDGGIITEKEYNRQREAILDRNR